MRLIAYALAASLAASAVLALGAVGCMKRLEIQRYQDQHIPLWILEEWRYTQGLLASFDSIKEYGDPHSVAPDSVEWLLVDRPFKYTEIEILGSDIDPKKEYEDKLLLGLYNYDDFGITKQVIICCEKRLTVRHEAAHAILHALGDPRYRHHYPELLLILSLSADMLRSQEVIEGWNWNMPGGGWDTFVVTEEEVK